MIKITTKKVLKPVDDKLFFATWVVAGIAVSEVVSVDVLLEVLADDEGGRLLVDSGIEDESGADCSFDIGVTDELIDLGVVVAVE